MKRILVTIFAGMFVVFLNSSDVWAQATAQIGGIARDQSGAVLPGVEIRAIQIETGITRGTITNETGSYVLQNLAIGPYRLEASLPGFRTYAQTGIVLQVNSSPVINVVLEVGQVAETVEVQANAAMVETRTAGIGQVIENARILELPLNGRAMIELVALAGASTPAPIVDGGGGRDPFSKGNVSVAGGLNTGLNFTLDGAFHNNPQDQGYTSMPFPDALQEFKVETGATGAQNGMKSSGSVSLVTKSGTNELHGNFFEFVRNGIFNARNAFAAKRDTIKRNQFGGTIGGPISRNKLFFFAGYQGTAVRQDPSDLLAFVPTAAILAGDFTAFTSPACNAGRQTTLRAPFVNNQINPALFSKPAVALAAKLPKSTDPCGRYTYGMPLPENGHMVLGRLDYQRSANHSIFGRYLLDSIETTPPYNVTKELIAGASLSTGSRGLAQAFTLGDTYLFGPNIVNAFRLTANRIYGEKTLADWSKAGAGPADIGVKAFAYQPHVPDYSVTGGFNTQGQQPGAGKSPTAMFAGSNDLSVLRGNHQMAFGTQVVLFWANSYSDTYSKTGFAFNGQTTGLGMADFFMGNVSQFSTGTDSEYPQRSKLFGVFGSDTWKVNQRLTLNYGLRWEPFFPVIRLDGSAMHFDKDAMRKGVRSKRFDTTPPGVLYEGDPGFPAGNRQGMYNKWWNFSPRLGLAWDVNGDGRMSVRASVGMFYDYPSTLFLGGISLAPPWVPRVILQNVDFENPWANYPGGDPHPMPHGRSVGSNAPWPLYAIVTSLDYDTPNMQVFQRNLSIQKQFGTDWLVSASYLGNQTSHLWSTRYINPAVYLGLEPCTLNGIRYTTCSTATNTDQRRGFGLENPATGQFFGPVGVIDAGGTASYNGLILSAERRAARGVTISGNYTWSHCISDPGGLSRGALGTNGYTNPDSRRFDRGNCTIAASDRRHVFNMSALAETPQFSNAALRAVVSGWRFSPIVKVLSGGYLSITTNQDRALNGSGGQRVNQVLGNPYGAKTANNFLDPAAFALPAFGTLGNSGAGAVAGPGYWQFDAALSRVFQMREGQRLEFRAEAFNVTNSVRLNDPTTNLNSNIFGQITTAKDPRIMQFALKYVF